MDEPKDVSMKKVELATEVAPDTMKGIFRLIFAGDDSISELLPGMMTVRIQDIEELNRKIVEKLSHYTVPGMTFSAMLNYENGKSENRSSWDSFIRISWTTPDVLESVCLCWKFLVLLPNNPKPAMHTINVQISSAVKPLHLFQAMLSKDPEELKRIDAMMVPVVCRVDFGDHMLSQELLNIVSIWHKGLRAPESVFPFLKRVQKHATGLRDFIRYSIPILASSACVGYYYEFTRAYPSETVVTTRVFTEAITWMALTGAIVVASCFVGKGLGQYLYRQLLRYGRFNILELTNGDKKRQDMLVARSSNYFWKILATSIFALALNIISAIITANWFSQ